MIFQYFLLLFFYRYIMWFFKYILCNVIAAESLVSYAGERFDFVINMDQSVDNYWIRFRGLMDCDERFTSAYQVAKLRYEGAPDEDPITEVLYDRVRNNSYGLVCILMFSCDFHIFFKWLWKHFSCSFWISLEEIKKSFLILASKRFKWRNWIK